MVHGAMYGTARQVHSALHGSQHSTQLMDGPVYGIASGVHGHCMAHRAVHGTAPEACYAQCSLQDAHSSLGGTCYGAQQAQHKALTVTWYHLGHGSMVRPLSLQYCPDLQPFPDKGLWPGLEGNPLALQGGAME